MTIKEILEKAVQIYRETLEKEWQEKRGKSTIRVIANEGTPYEKVYEEDGNFFLCGFVGIKFKKNENKGLKEAIENLGLKLFHHDYDNTWEFAPDTFLANGDYLLKEKAINEAVDFLKQNGLKVWANCQLD